MNGFEDASFDLSEARESVSTAIELLRSMHTDGEAPHPSVPEVVNSLQAIKAQLEKNHQLLLQFAQEEELVE